MRCHLDGSSWQVVGGGTVEEEKYIARSVTIERSVRAVDMRDIATMCLMEVPVS